MHGEHKWGMLRPFLSYVQLGACVWIVFYSIFAPNDDFRRDASRSTWNSCLRPCSSI